MNPYWDVGFFSFLMTFFYRVGLFLTGQLSIEQLAADELQFLVLAFVGISCAVIGAFLVIKKMTMMANSITHTILVGIVIAFFLQSIVLGGAQSVLHIDMRILMLASFITAMITMVATDLLHRVFRLQEDASIGLVFSLFFAIGIVLVTILSRNSHIGSEIIMGNVDMIHKDDLKSSFWIMIVNVIFAAVFYKELVITAFDSIHAKMQKVSILAINYLLMFQTSLTIISGFRAVGLVLVLALLVAPVLTARLWMQTLPNVIGVAIAISTATSLFACAVTRSILSTHEVALSTAGVTVTLHLVLFILSLLFAPRKGIISCYLFEKVLKNQTRESEFANA